VSDTPRTDAAAIRCACSTYVVPSEFARELERENAALRAISIEAMISNTAFRMKELERENAALRVDKERLDWLGKTKCAYFHEGPFVWRINEDETTDGDTIRAAIDAARKEAQP
jgi:hypothetical protein